MMVLDVCLPRRRRPSDDPRRDGADAPLGAAEPRGADEPASRRCSRSCRAASSPALRSGVGARSSRSTRSTASRSAASRWATRARERSDVVARAAELLPRGRPRYLMGVGTPRGPPRGDRAGRRHVRLRHPDVARVAGHRLHVDGPRPPHARRSPRSSDEPLDARAAAPPAAATRAATCTTCSSARSRSARGCSRIHNLHHYLDAHARGARGDRGGPLRASSRARRSRRSTGTSTTPTRRPPGARARGARARGRPASSSSRPRAGRPPCATASPARSCTRWSAPPRSRRGSTSRSRGSPSGSPTAATRSCSSTWASARPPTRSRRCSAAERRRRTRERLEIVSFERDTGALAFATTDERRRAPRARRAARARRRARAARRRASTRRRACAGGSSRATRSRRCPTRSCSRRRRLLGSVLAPAGRRACGRCARSPPLRARCGPRATVFTYSTATARAQRAPPRRLPRRGRRSDRSEGRDHRRGGGPADLARPLDERWLERLARSSAPFPADARGDALERVRAHAQFNSARADLRPPFVPSVAAPRSGDA